MSKEKDYRVSYLLQHFSDETFKIDRIEDGNIIFVSENGKKLDLKCSLPRKIVNIDGNAIIEVTKKCLTMKDKPDIKPIIEFSDGSGTSVNPPGGPKVEHTEENPGQIGNVDGTSEEKNTTDPVATPNVTPSEESPNA